MKRALARGFFTLATPVPRRTRLFFFPRPTLSAPGSAPRAPYFIFFCVFLLSFRCCRHEFGVPLARRCPQLCKDQRGSDRRRPSPGAISSLSSFGHSPPPPPVLQSMLFVTFFVPPFRAVQRFHDAVTARYRVILAPFASSPRGCNSRTQVKAGRGPPDRDGKNPLAKALVISQVELSLVILVGARLFLPPSRQSEQCRQVQQGDVLASTIANQDTAGY